MAMQFRKSAALSSAIGQITNQAGRVMGDTGSQADLRPDVAAALARMQWTFGGKREIKNLEKYLQGQEQVLEMTQGVLNEKQGLLVLTTERLIFVFHGLMNASSEDFPLEVVSTISYHSKWRLGDQIVVHASGASHTVSNVMKADAERLVAEARKRTGRRNASAAVTGVPGNDDVMGQLERLAKLRDAGAVSQDEFDEHKARLLGRL